MFAKTLSSRELFHRRMINFESPDLTWLFRAKLKNTMSIITPSAARILLGILLSAMMSGCAAQHVEEVNNGPRPTVYCMVQGKRQRDLADEISAKINKSVSPGAVKITIIEIGQDSGIIEQRNNKEENDVLSQCCQKIDGGKFFLGVTPRFAVCDKYGKLKIDNGQAAQVVSLATALSRPDSGQTIASSTRPTQANDVSKLLTTTKQAGDNSVAEKVTDKSTQTVAAPPAVFDAQDIASIRSLATEKSAVSGENVATRRTMPYPNVSGNNLGQIGAVKEKLPPDSGEHFQGTLQILGDQCFFKGDYSGARTYYLRSISVEEAVARRIYGEEKEPTIQPAKTANDAVQLYKSIKAVTVDKQPNGAYTIVMNAAQTLHFLALVEDLQGAYPEADQLFRAAYRQYNGQANCPPFPPSFGPDAGVAYAENAYRQLLSTVVSKFGPQSAYASTRLEQLSICLHQQPQWAYSAAVEKGATYTKQRIKDEMAQNPYTEERRQKVQLALRQAIKIRQLVKEANDPDVLHYDIAVLWNRTPGSGTFANFCSKNGYSGVTLPVKP